MSERLDLTRPYGKICGTSGNDTRAFTQDGKFFLQNGYPWSDTPAAPVVAQAPPPKRSHHKPKTPLQVAAAMMEMKIDPAVTTALDEQVNRQMEA